MKYQAKYYDGKRPLSIPVTWELREESLVVIFENGGVMNWPFSDLKQDESHNTAIVILNQLTHEKIELVTGEENLPRHLLKRNKIRFSSKLMFTFMGGIIVLLTFFWLSMPLLSNYIAQKIPFEHEKALGDKLLTNFIREGKICQPSKEAEIALKKMIMLLDPANKVDIKIMESPEVNAFTFPGGKILIMNGLLKNVKSSDELAGVMAHEISHVRRRHVLQKIINALSIFLTIHFFAGDFSSVVALDPSTLAAIGALTFDRRMEREADQDALESLIKLGINPESMVSFFKREASLPESLNFLSTHPGDEERILLFGSRKIKSHSVSPLTPTEWKSLQSYCEADRDLTK